MKAYSELVSKHQSESDHRPFAVRCCSKNFPFPSLDSPIAVELFLHLVELLLRYGIIIFRGVV
jgi:hypothetical protein